MLDPDMLDFNAPHVQEFMRLLEEIQSNIRLEVESPDGLVSLSLNGKPAILALDINEKLLDRNHKAKLEKLILKTYEKGAKLAFARVEEEMEELKKKLEQQEQQFKSPPIEMRT